MAVIEGPTGLANARPQTQSENLIDSIEASLRILGNKLEPVMVSRPTGSPSSDKLEETPSALVMRLAGIRARLDEIVDSIKF